MTDKAELESLIHEVAADTWHFDKKVPIALIAAIVFQTCGLVWFGAQLSIRVDVLERVQASHAASLLSIINKDAALERNLAILEQSKKHISNQLNKIDEKVDEILDK